MKMKKIVGIVLSMVMVIGLLPWSVVYAADPVVISSNDSGALLINRVPASDSDFYYEGLTIETYLLPAGDYVLEQNLNIGRPICVNSGAVSLDIKTFNITNDNSNQGETGGSAIIITEGATFTLNGESGVLKSTANTSKRGGGVLVHYGNFIMNGGNISGNNVPIGAGVYVYGDGNFEMKGGKISNNTGWGGITNQGTFSMTGGEISNNTNCGINMWNSNVTLSGTAKIIGNKNASGEDCNLPLGDDKTITVGKFSTGAQIGITANSQRPFSIGYNTKNSGIAPATYFKSDDSRYAVALTDGGEAQLVSGYTVTYKVVNGTWSDGTKTDIPEDVASGEKPAKVPTGMKPAEGYTGGAWDKDPTAAIITEATMFTYTFDAESAAVVKEAPKAKDDLTYTGSPQELVTGGTAEGGTMQYAIGTSATTPPTEGWSTAIPTGTEAGTYYVWYKAVGDGTHTDSTPVCITVKIEGVTYTATDGEHTISDGKDAAITVKREPDDSKTYDLYTGAQVDGKDLPEGSHTTAKGSLILTLKAAYLDTLTVGDHKLTISFEDGSATATIKVKEAEPTPTPAPTAAPTATPKPVPKTGDSADLALWLGLILLGLLGIGGFAVMKSRK